MPHDNIQLGTLKSRSEFLFVRAGVSVARAGLVVQMRANPVHPNEIRMGFTATKKIGNAVVRNRAKRRLRALARALLPVSGLLGMDYVFIARFNTANMPWQRLFNEAQIALSSVNEMRIKRKSL